MKISKVATALKQNNVIIYDFTEQTFQTKLTLQIVSFP